MSCWTREPGSYIPRGRASHAVQVGQYKLGGSRLAVDTGAPVVHCSHVRQMLAPPESWIKTPAPEVSIGKPIPSVAVNPMN